MSVAVKARPISITFKPRTPPRVISSIRREYAQFIENQSVDSFDWFSSDIGKELDKQLTPGVYLKTLREAHDWTQATLGEKIGVSSTRVSDFENELRAISKDIAKKLAEVFKTSPARFI